MHCPAILLLAMFLVPHIAGEAVADQWHEEEGASIRLVTSGPPSAEGKLEGALEIRLEPGWKTYWREPGESGVPPSITIAPEHDMAQPVIEFPPPVWIDDGYSRWAGYEQYVALPVTFELGESKEAFMAEVFLGLCETVCIPVQAQFTIDPNVMFSHRDAIEVVHDARAALPDQAHADFRVTGVEVEIDTLLVHVNLPAGVDGAELFIASEGMLSFGQPEFGRRSGRDQFRVPLMNGGDVSQLRLARYTLVAGDEAVQGMIDFTK